MNVGASFFVPSVKPEIEFSPIKQENNSVVANAIKIALISKMNLDAPMFMPTGGFTPLLKEKPKKKTNKKKTKKEGEEEPTGENKEGAEKPAKEQAKDSTAPVNSNQPKKYQVKGTPAPESEKVAEKETATPVETPAADLKKPTIAKGVQFGNEPK